LQYLDPADLRPLTENPDPNIFLIDVRPAAAYNAGHIPTALSFPSTEIAGRLTERPLDDPNKYLIVHCETGGRAQQVITGVLEPNGYTRFMNWGGVYRWPYGFVTD
jgi:rhodanese-related sulfurtransferase